MSFLKNVKSAEDLKLEEIGGKIKAIAARRYLAELSGITVEGLRVATDDRAKLLISCAAFEAKINPDYTLKWKGLEGFVDLTGAQVIAIARAIRAHVQACFDREAELIAKLENESLSDADIDEGWPPFLAESELTLAQHNDQR